MFAADCYHLNKYGRLVYGEEYVAMRLGTVPSFMYELMKIKDKMPFFYSSEYGLSSYAEPDFNLLSASDIEALEYGISEYADLTFAEVKEKNHQHRAWKKHEKELETKNKVEISYEDMIDNPEVLEYLEELGDMTEKMGF